MDHDNTSLQDHPASLATPRCAALTRQAYPCSDDRYPASIGSAIAYGGAASFRAVYEELTNRDTHRLQAQRRALALLRDALDAVAGTTDDLPSDPQGLDDWMAASA